MADDVDKPVGRWLQRKRAVAQLDGKRGAGCVRRIEALFKFFLLRAAACEQPGAQRGTCGSRKQA